MRVFGGGGGDVVVYVWHDRSLFRKQRLKEQVDVAKVFKKASPEQLQVELVEHKVSLSA